MIFERFKATHVVGDVDLIYGKIFDKPVHAWKNKDFRLYLANDDNAHSEVITLRRGWKGARKWTTEGVVYCRKPTGVMLMGFFLEHASKLNNSNAVAAAFKFMCARFPSLKDRHGFIFAFTCDSMDKLAKAVEAGLWARKSTSPRSKASIPTT